MPGPTLVPNLWLCCTSSGPSMAGGSIPARFRPRRWAGTGPGRGGDRAGTGTRVSGAGRACARGRAPGCQHARVHESERACMSVSARA